MDQRYKPLYYTSFIFLELLMERDVMLSKQALSLLLNSIVMKEPRREEDHSGQISD
jgi:hypothetical protein